MYQKTVGFVQAIKMGFNRFLSISGRSSRSEFWWWYLFIVIISYLVTIPALSPLFSDPTAFATAANPTELYAKMFAALGTGSSLALFLLWIFEILAMVPITCRRLHDTGRGAGWFFISFVPFIGGIWLFILLLLPSEPQTNRFGEIPNLAESGW